MKLFLVILLFVLIKVNYATDEEDAALLLNLAKKRIDDMDSEIEENTTDTTEKNFIEPLLKKNKFSKNVSPLDEAPLYYLLSRLCYEKRIKKTTKLGFTQFGDKIFGDDEEMKDFRKKFGINKNYAKKGPNYYKIKDYFYKKGCAKHKQCPLDISGKIAFENYLYWKSVAENHRHFNDLKQMGNILFSTTGDIDTLDNLDEKYESTDFDSKKTSPYDEAPLYYLLSKFCYEKRILNTTKLSLNKFGAKFFGDNEEMKDFRKKFGIKENYGNKGVKYYTIHNYFNKKAYANEKRCPPDITPKKAFENYLYWKMLAENHRHFNDLKQMGNILFSTSGTNNKNHSEIKIL